MPQVKSLTPQTPLADLDWLPPMRQRQLARMGTATVGQLLLHFPRRHEDRTRFDRWPDGGSDEPVCVCGVVKSSQTKRVRVRIHDVVIVEENPGPLSPPVVLRWFNSPWVEKMLAVGQRVVVFGRPKLSGGKVVIAHPEFEAVEEDAEAGVHLERIVPVHPATEGLSTRVIRRVVWDLLERITDDHIPDRLPAGLDPHPRAWALRQIHFPDSTETLAAARRHLVLEEFFGMQLCVAARRNENVIQPGAAHCGPGELTRRLHASLPFPLTAAQQRAIADIRADLQSPRPMNRLLHGDVGSGKTLVAMSAMLFAVEAGFQAALMAPTQILAEQHYLNFRRLLDPLGLRVALRTGARREDAGALPLLDGNLSEEPDILIGTHALLYEGAGFTRLGLAVVDEQHKFGVLQRAKLREQGTSPDVLVMTATPIPRTLTMTLYGDLDVSVLDELPAGRGKIVTGVRDAVKVPDAGKFLAEQLAEGRQAYIVYPLIEQSERLEAKAAAAEFEKWRMLLAPHRCELLTGRTPPEEKDAIMDRFRRAETRVLVATTVIEVGIDVPNANIMLIENAERFGLAQLHQLRGRIGRGAHKSYCILFSEKLKEPDVAEKLGIMEETTDGFVIAEADLRIRGPGDLLSTAQSGLPPYKLGDPIHDLELMRQARVAAFLLLERDPDLSEPGHERFRRLLDDRRKVALAAVS